MAQEGRVVIIEEQVVRRDIHRGTGPTEAIAITVGGSAIISVHPGSGEEETTIRISCSRRIVVCPKSYACQTVWR